MKSIIWIFLLFFAVGCGSFQKNGLYEISGILSDYNGKPLANGVVRLKGSKFKNLYEVKTNTKGEFSIKAPKGEYLALYAVKGYGVDFLEFWYWDLVLDRNLHKNIKIDTLEVYGLKAWKTYGGLMLYFRPMSLLKYKKTGAVGNKDPRGGDIAPTLSKSSIKVSVAGKKAEVRTFETVDEFTSKRIGTMDGVLINASYPEGVKSSNWHEVCVDIKGKVLKEKGMACVSMRDLPWSF